MKCIITGCRFIDVDKAHVWGDLYDDADDYIFVCCMDGPSLASSPAWDFSDPGHHLTNEKRIYAHNSNWFEKRGVLIIRKEDCGTNESAWAHIQEGKKRG